MICTQIIKITKLIREGQPSHKLNTMEQLRFTPKKEDDLFKKLTEQLKPLGDYLAKWEAEKPKFIKGKYGVIMKTLDMEIDITEKDTSRITVSFHIDTDCFDIDTTMEVNPNDPDTEEFDSLDDALYEMDEKDLILKAIELIKIKL